MNSEDNERLVRLEVRIQTLESVMTRVEAELSQVSKLLATVSDIPKELVLQPSPPLAKTEVEWTGLEVPVEKNLTHTPENKEDWEVRFGKVWMPRIFVVVLLIGVVFGFLAAAKAGWLSRPVRIGLGYAAFVGLVTYGEMQMRKGHDALAQVLLGGSTAMAVVTTFAASTLYGYVPPTPAFVLDVVFALCGVFFSYRHRSEVLGVLSIIAMILVPFLVKSGHPHLTVFVSYESVASFGFALFALRRRYKYLLTLSLMALHVSFFAVFLFRNVVSEDFVGPTTLQAVLVLLTVIYGDIKANGTSPVQKIRFGRLFASWVSIGLSALWVYGEMPASWFHAYLWVAAAVFFGVAAAGWNQQRTVFQTALLPFWPFLLMALFHVESHAAFYVSFVLVAFAAFVVGTKSSRLLARAEGVILFVISGIVLLGAYNVFIPHAASWTEHVTWAVYTGAAFTLIYPLFPKDWSAFKNYGVWFGIAVLGAFLTHESQVMTFSRSPNVQHMMLTFVWILYAIGSIAFGVWKSELAYRRFGTVFLFVTLSKLILIDIPAVTLFVRAILFIALGGLGVLTSRVFYRRKP